MTILSIVIFILLGLLLLLIEFAIIPGITIAGIGGFLLLGASVFIAFTHYGMGIGFLTLAVVLIASPLMIYYFFRSKSGKKMILGTQIDGKMEYVDLEKLKVGDVGKSIGRLAPSGKVKINGITLEARSSGSFIDHKTEVRITKILSNVIIVEPLKKE